MKAKKTSLKDIAKLVGCSTTTVSNVLNGKGLFGEEVKEKVLKAVKKYNYSINASARNLRMGITETIGVLFYRPNADIFKSEYYLTMMYSLQKELFKQGYEILLSEYTDENAINKEVPRIVRNGRVDGVVILGGFPNSAGKMLSELNIPTIMLDSFSEHLDSIITDGANSVFNSVKALVELGHKRLSYFAYKAEDYNTENRINGFKKAICELSLDENICRVVRNFSTNEEACEQFEKMIESSERPTAILASNDSLGASLLEHANKMGLSVPKEISFFGYDDTYVSTRCVPQLSTVHVDTNTIGIEGAKMIVERIKNPSKPIIHKIFDCQLRLRSSISHRS